MRLKSIKLAGFKSFVDNTKVDLPSQITAIVGPNGCGKSNTIDAVRWVMGESSAKQLRGESMADVIFNGSVHRSPVGQASIELHFENTFGRLGGEYSSYGEIVIRRQVTRDGQSNYYLNGTRCRRKDITDIFLGTGLGPRSYAIIEQGTISRLIEAKPEELRVFLEEAAGISRYKERRKETNQRIEHTRDNLARINDVREELTKQVAHLERQAKTAEKYKEYKAEERSLRAQLFAARYKNLQLDFVKNNTEVEQLQNDIQLNEEQYAQLSEQLQSQFDNQHQTQKHVEQFQEKHAELNAALRVCEQNIQHNKNQQQQFELELKQITQQQQEADHLSTLDNSSIEQLKLSLETLQEELIQLEQQLEERQRLHQQAAVQQKNWQSQWQEINLQVANCSQTAQVEQTRLQQIEQRLQQLKTQQQKFHDEKQTLVTDEDELKFSSLQEQLENIDEARSNEYEKLAAHDNQLKTYREQQQALLKSINEARSQLQQLEGKLTALNTLQQQALGRQEQNVQSWLSKHQLDQAERLANSIEVDAAYERHLEHYLGEKLQAIALSDFNSLDELIADFPQGYVDFIQASPATQTGQQNHDVVSLASKVKGPAALLQQLDQVYCADNLNQALVLIQNLPEQAEIITPDGIVVQKNWLQIRRGKDEQSGVLQRKREITELQQTLTQAKLDLEILEQQQAEIETEIQQAEQEKLQAQKQCQELDQQRHQCNAQVQIQQSQLQQKRDRLQTLSQEFETAIQEYQQLEAQHASSRELWQNALNMLNELHSQKDQLADQQTKLDTELTQANRNLRETEEAMQQQRIKEQKFTTEHQGLISQQQRTSQQLQHLAQRQKTLLQHLDQLKPALITLEQDQEILREQLADAELQLEQVKATMGEGEKALRNIETARQGISQKLEKLRQQYSTHQIQAEHAQTKSSSILEQFAELDLDFNEVSANLPEAFSESDSQAELEQLQNRISRLGAINLAAISELSEQLERKQFIDKQYDDLIEALNTLETAIREIDKETRTKFQETYDTVNNNFKELFPKIFGGGQAYLSLTSEDLLDTGVIVFAQPPGKRNSTIHLLSGGEKALTALALVFGIFELNPAPFCMLDEVDAPLDDANVGRFCNLVRAMAKKTQFVVVTHNKVAMEMADHLMGVTMHEPGVSRLVAVDVEAAIAMAAQE